MWSNTGPIPDAASPDRNAVHSVVSSSFAFHTLGLLVNIWKVSHPVSRARSTDRATEPAIEMWTPHLTMGFQGELDLKE